MLAKHLLGRQYDVMENEGFTPMVNGNETFGLSLEREDAAGVEVGDSDLDLPERLALNYAPRKLKRGYEAFFRLDAQLCRSAELPREPALIQLRLAWWRDALGFSGKLGAASHPLLHLVASSLPGATEELTGLVDGWEAASVGEDTVAGARELGAARGRIIANLADETGGVGDGASRWTLVELASRRRGDASETALLKAARHVPDTVLARRLRPLAVLEGLAARALKRGGGPLLGDRLSPLAAIRLGILGR